MKIGADKTVTARVYRAGEAGRIAATLILGHGAGAHQSSPFMVYFAEGLASRGVDVVTFNFPYMEEGRRVPDPAEKLQACYRAAISSVRALAGLHSNRLFIGGKSLGGRIASQLAADSPDVAGVLAGLIFLGYPLHPPGRAQQLRARHLGQIRAPMLFIQGSRDAFGTPDELRPVIESLGTGVRLYVVEGGDHSLTVPKKSTISQGQIYAAVQEEMVNWMRGPTH